MTATQRLSALRQGDGSGRVTNVELFFDLVYVFAVTQLSHLLLQHTTADGAVETAVLLAMVWQVWVYTTWVINYLDPNRNSVRAMLLLLMLASLVLAAALPDAFRDRGLLVAITYAGIQVGRTVYAIWALRGEILQIVFLRILTWTLASSALVLLGVAESGHGRELLWAAGIAVDLIGASAGFWVPGLGRSSTAEWKINGAHFAERCQAFVLIALGESVVVIGELLRLEDPSARDIAAFVAAFLGVVALWWIYFDRSAGDSAEVIESSADPGRLARSAFHYVHPIIIAGIIVTAAADERVLDDPGAPANASTSWLLLGGTALFLGGHAIFKAVVWRNVSWPRVVAVVALGLLGFVAPHVSLLALGVATLAVVVCVAIGDRLLHPVDAVVADVAAGDVAAGDAT